MLNEPHSVYGYEKRVYQRPGLRRQACSPLIQLFFGFASDIDQTNINGDIRDSNWLSSHAFNSHSRALTTKLVPNQMIYDVDFTIQGREK